MRSGFVVLPRLIIGWSSAPGSERLLASVVQPCTYPPFVRSVAGNLPDPYPVPACCGRNVPRVGPVCMSASFSPVRGRPLTTRPSRVRLGRNGRYGESGRLRGDHRRVYWKRHDPGPGVELRYHHGERRGPAKADEYRRPRCVIARPSAGKPDDRQSARTASWLAVIGAETRSDDNNIATGTALEQDIGGDDRTLLSPGYPSDIGLAHRGQSCPSGFRQACHTSGRIPPGRTGMARGLYPRPGSTCADRAPRVASSAWSASGWAARAHRTS